MNCQLKNELIFVFQTSKPTFIAYFNENKAEFERDNPELTPAELTKHAMNKYRQIYSNKTNGNDVEINGKDDASKSSAPAVKRKITPDDNEQRSGIAKLSRFSFKKQ